MATARLVGGRPVAGVLCSLVGLTAGCISGEVSQDPVGRLKPRQDARVNPPPPATPDAARPVQTPIEPAPDLGRPPDARTPDAPQPDVGPPNPCVGQEFPFNGHCYSMLGYKWIDFATAKAICAQVKAQVASIGSAAENDFIFSLMPLFVQSAWIGLERKPGNLSEFTWPSGEPVTFKKWTPGEPNNSKGIEQCAIMFGAYKNDPSLHGKWNDVPCVEPPRDSVICERVPPATPPTGP